MTAGVIITGGGGFLGQCLATALLKRGCLLVPSTSSDDDDEEEKEKEVPLTHLILENSGKKILD